MCRVQKATECPGMVVLQLVRNDPARKTLSSLSRARARACLFVFRCCCILLVVQVHEAVIAAGKTRSGCTVHQVTEEVDSGPIVVQEEVEVVENETPESLKAKVRSACVAFLSTGGSQP